MTEAMPYTQSLLTNGRAAAYHAKAAPPTVTMPRLKVNHLAEQQIVMDGLKNPYVCIACRQWYLVQLEVSWMWH